MTYCDILCRSCIIVFKCHLCTHNAIVLWPKGPDGRGLGDRLSSCPWQWPNLSSYSHHSKAVLSLTSLVPVSLIYCNLATTKRVLSNFAGYAEENSFVNYGNSFCYYNCTVDVSMAPQCRNHANISVSSSPPTANQSILTSNGLNYNISDLQRCQRYTVEVTAQVGAHKYTNQTQNTVMLCKSA